jgi:uncharacterized protein YndB with AHSA1/START domain
MQIEKTVLLKASRDRVWRALTDSKEFGIWFGARWPKPFAVGPMKGEIAPTQVDPDVAKKQQAYDGMPFQIEVTALEPKTRFAFQWHPFGVDKTVDYSREPMTQVTFTLEDAPGGILLRVTETGFDELPESRRRKAFEANDGGWALQVKLLETYLDRDR